MKAICSKSGTYKFFKLNELQELIEEKLGL